MTVAVSAPSAAAPCNQDAALSPSACRCVLALVIVAAGVAGLLITSPPAAAQAAIHAGADLTRLLRAMAALKMLMALGVASAVMCRLGTGATLPWFGAYAVACGSMAVGPGLIWSMAHTGAGALCLHAGLLGGVILLWRDPVVALRLAAAVTARRAAIAARR